MLGLGGFSLDFTVTVWGLRFRVQSLGCKGLGAVVYLFAFVSGFLL